MMKRQQLCMIVTACSALCTFLIIAVVAMTLMPKFNNLYDTLIVTSENLEVVSNELREAKIGDTLQSLDDLIAGASTDLANASSDLTGAMERINSIDIDTLNTSIQSLHDVVTPMAEFFGRFR